MKKGSDFRIGVLVAVAVVLTAVGPAVAQSVSVIVDQASANPGDSVTGRVQIEALPSEYSAYRGHTLRVQVDPPEAVESISYGDGDLANSGAGSSTITALGYTFMSSIVIQAGPVFTDITAFPATTFTFTLQLSNTFSGVTLHLFQVGEAGVPTQLTSAVAITGVQDGASVGIPLSVPPFEGLIDATITTGGATPSPTDTPGDTPTPTNTPVGPTPTPTPEETPLPGAYIVLDGLGGIHSIGTAPDVTGNALYYPGIDIVKDMDILPDNSGVVVIDGWGATFVFVLDGTPNVDMTYSPPFTPDQEEYVAAESAADSAGYWVLSDIGQIYGVGSVLDAVTQSLIPSLAVDPPLPFFDPNESPSVDPSGNPIPEDENPGWYSAVDFGVVDDGAGFVVVDRWGGQHLLGVTSAIGINEDMIKPYFGWDIARAIEIDPLNRGYIILDGFGAIHPVPVDETAPVREAYYRYLDAQPYFGWDVAEMIAYTPDGMGWVTLDAFGGTHYAGNIEAIRVLYFGWDIARDIEIYVPIPD